MQQVETCDEHESCTVITDGDWPDGAGAWRSHMSSDVPAEVRLNLDYPEAEDVR